MIITVDDILDLLPIVADRGWHEDSIQAIRNKDDECPICCLVNEILETDYKITAWDAGNRIDIPESTITVIADAADFVGSPHRARLMQALGMT